MTERLAAGMRAMESGDLETARESFAAAAAEGSAAGALRLGDLLSWSGDTLGALRAWRTAYGRFCRGPEADTEMAAEAAIALALVYEASLGNLAAARGWLARLERLVSGSAVASLRGWALVLRAVLHPDEDAEGCARSALAIARAAGDRDLELCALCEVGVAAATQGRVREGLAALGEAMAATLGGEVERPDTVVYCCCRTIVTCSRTSEVAQGAQWIRAAGELLGGDASLHLHVLCRAHLGGVLFATGRGMEAERELVAAIALARGAELPVHAEAVAGLAELRLAQGRLEEAQRLVAGLSDEPATSFARAALHLALGENAAAARAAGRRARSLPTDPLGAAPCVELLVRAELAGGAPESAGARAEELLAFGARLDCDLVRARGERALAECRVAAGDAAAAADLLERALDAFAARGLVYEAAVTRLALARALAAEQPDAAIAEARTALAAFEELGAAGADAAAGLLRSLGVRAARGGPRRNDGLTKRESEVLLLLAEGLSNRAIAERLFLSVKTVEHHVHSVLAKLDLASRAEAAAHVARAARWGFSSMLGAPGCASLRVPMTTDQGTMTMTTQAAAVQAELWSERAQDWAEVMESGAAWLGPVYDEVLHRMEVGRGSRVLDAGCGAGAFVERAARRGAEVSAIDITPAFVELASRRVPGADVRLGDLQSLPWEDETFDLVTGFNSYFYAEDPVAAFAEARRVLRPAGHLAVTGLGRSDRGDSAAMFSLIADHLPPGALNEDDGPSLEQQIEAAGLSVTLAEYRDNTETYADLDTYLRGLLAAAPLRRLARTLGEDELASLIRRTYDGRAGTLQLTDEYRVIVARRQG